MPTGSVSTDNVVRPGAYGVMSNFAWSLFGSFVPLLFALCAIPLIISGFGTTKFGILTLAWSIVGYFSIFEFGIGKAITKFLAERPDVRNDSEGREIVWTGISMMLALGMVSASGSWYVSPWLVGDFLSVGEQHRAETILTFRIIALSIPAITVSAGFIGVLQGLNMFKQLSLIRIPLGLSNLLMPLIALNLGGSIVLAVLLLALTRYLALAIYIVVACKALPSLRHEWLFDLEKVGKLLSLGGWMTVSNTVGPIMTYLDRFIIGAVLSVSIVAYYTTPYEAVIRVGVISGALSGVLFPAFSYAYLQDRDSVGVLLKRGFSAIYILLFPVAIVLVMFSDEFMYFWLGKEFQENSAAILRWLAIGIFINGFGQVYFSFLQGIGRPDITAKIHLIELPLYLFFLVWALNSFGVLGAAIAWVLRVFLDLILWHVICSIFLRKRILPSLSVLTLPWVLGFQFISFTFFSDWSNKMFLTVFWVLCSVIIVWRLIFDNSDRIAIRRSFFGAAQT